MAGLVDAILLVRAMAILFREGVHEDSFHREYVIYGQKRSDVPPRTFSAFR